MTRHLALSRDSIRPLRHYCFIHNQGYEFVDDFWCDAKRGHNHIPDYDDVSCSGTQRGLLILCSDKTCLVNIPSVMCFMYFKRID